jgi:hypothetical protein
MYTPTPRDVHVNTPLTQISITYLQQQDQFVAAQICPVIPVEKQSDRYYVYNRGDFFRDQITLARTIPERYLRAAAFQERPGCRRNSARRKQVATCLEGSVTFTSGIRRVRRRNTGAPSS